MSSEVLQDWGVEGTVGIELLGQRLAVEEQMSPKLLRSQKGKVGLGEAQGAADRDLVMHVAIQGVPDRGDLALQAIDELGAVTAADEQLGRTKPWRLDLDLALPVFGVDHVDAGRGDGDVIDVAAPARHPPVVQSDDRAAGRSLGQRVRNRTFGDGALVKRAFMLRRVTHGEQQPADVRMGISRASLTVVLAPLVLAFQARTRLPGLQRVAGNSRVGRGGHVGGPAPDASHGAGALVPPRPRSRGNRRTARGARVRAANSIAEQAPALHRSRRNAA